MTEPFDVATLPLSVSPGLPSEPVSHQQVGGSHYHIRPIQPITYIQANNLGYEEGNVVKYITRHADKGGAEDLKKLIQYTAFILEHEYGVATETTYKETTDV